MSVKVRQYIPSSAMLSTPRTGFKTPRNNPPMTSPRFNETPYQDQSCGLSFYCCAKRGAGGEILLKRRSWEIRRYVWAISGRAFPLNGRPWRCCQGWALVGERFYNHTPGQSNAAATSGLLHSVRKVPSYSSYDTPKVGSDWPLRPK